MADTRSDPWAEFSPAPPRTSVRPEQADPWHGFTPAPSRQQFEIIGPDGSTYAVEAPDQASAVAAFKKMQAGGGTPGVSDLTNDELLSRLRAMDGGAPQQSGPWERYAPPTADTAGPWTRYAPPGGPGGGKALKDYSDSEVLQALRGSPGGLPQRIQAPDGSTVEFPAGMSDDEMTAVMRRTFGGPEMIDVPTYDAMGGVTGTTQIPTTAPLRSDPSNAFAHGVAQGATLGFGDELQGAVQGVRSWWNGEGFQAGYDRGVADRRGVVDRAAAAHPWAYGAGQVAGGAGVTLPAMVSAPTLFGLGGGLSMGRAAAQSAGAGMALGGVQGLGEGHGGVGDRLPGAGWGALTGGTVGYAAPIAGGVLGGVARAGADALAVAGSPILGLGRRAANTIAETYNAAPAGTIERRAAELGADTVVADLSPGFRQMTQGLAARPEGRARNLIEGTLEARDAGTNARVGRSLEDNLGPAPVPSEVEAQFAARRRAAGRIYQEATEAAGPVETRDALAVLGQRLNTAEGAERAALLRARDMLLPPRGPGSSRFVQTDARNLHRAKEALDDLIQYGDPQLGIPRGAFSSADSSVFQVRRALNDVLEAQVPRYADANLMARTAHRASEALESGRNALRPDVHPADFARDFAAAPIEAQAAARLGVRADVDRVVGNQANDLQAVRSTLKGEGDWNRAKAATAFGDEAVGRTVADVEREIAKRETYQKAVQGSKTAETTRAADAVDVRTASPSRTDTDIAIGSALGGTHGAAAALAVRGGRYGLGVLGRRSDIARNDQLAEALMSDPALLLSQIRQRAEAMAGRTGNPGPMTDAVVRALLTSGERQSEKSKTYLRELARQLQGAR